MISNAQIRALLILLMISNVGLYCLFAVHREKGRGKGKPAGKANAAGCF